MPEPTAADPRDELFVGPEGARRLGGVRCTRCATVTFPVAATCSKCTSDEVETFALKTRGTLWSWTIQGFPPKPPYLGSPDEFTPYGVGYVELDGEVRVEGRLTVADPAALEIGMPMELVLVDAPGRSDGTQAYAFAPAGAPA